ncbi:hypothetical protein ACFE04_014692 [Oxalis oulophora]
MTSGEVGNSKQVEKDANFELDTNSNCDGQKPGLDQLPLNQELTENTSEKGLILPVDEQILVQSASQTANGSTNVDGSGGKAENLNSVVENEDYGMELDANDDNAAELENRVNGLELSREIKTTEPHSLAIVTMDSEVGDEGFIQSYNFESLEDGDEAGTEEEQVAFRREVEAFYKERYLEFKAPKFYKEDLNLLKLWRSVLKLGGYEQVSCLLYLSSPASANCELTFFFREFVGDRVQTVEESRRIIQSSKDAETPHEFEIKTCTTVSWSFRIFYEKALLDYEKYRMPCGPFPLYNVSRDEGIEHQAAHSPAPGTGRARRDAAARAMQGWHSRRGLDSGEDKNSTPMLKSDRQPNTAGLLKRKNQSAEHAPRIVKPNFDDPVADVGNPAEHVKINVQRINDGFEIFALVPGLLREEVHVHTDPAGRLVISGEPKELDNPWGVTPFKKVVSLPSRIDPLQTSAVVTMQGQLFIRVPFEQSDP